MKLAFAAYMPDEDSTVPGVITDGNAFIPTERGLGGAPTAVNSLLAALAAACKGAASLTKLDGAQRFFAGTSVRLYEAGTTTWTDRSAGLPSDYTAVSYRWRFAQFGDTSLAASKENFLQSSSTGAFAAVAGAPKADIVETVNQFVFLFDTDDAGAQGNRLHSWWCSALGNAASWTPSVATQAATGILTSTPGKITAGRRFGDQVVVYKQHGMYLGSYIGPPFIWGFPEIPSDTGTFSQESVINIGTPEQPKHFFVGQRDFYVFDGSRPMSVGQGIRRKFFNDLNFDQVKLINLLHNRRHGLVYVFYPSGSSTTLNACVAWNYKTGRWGVDNRSVQFAAEFITPSLTYADLGTHYATYADFPVAPYGEAFLSGVQGQPAIFNTSNRLQVLNGLPGSAFMTSGDWGDDVNYGLLSRVKPTWITKPATADIECFNRASLGDALSTGPTAAMANSRFDVLSSARWHRVKMTLSGDFELNKLDAEVISDGQE